MPSGPRRQSETLCVCASVCAHTRVYEGVGWPVGLVCLGLWVSQGAGLSVLKPGEESLGQPETRLVTL